MLCSRSYREAGRNEGKPASVSNNKGDKKMNVSEIITEWLKEKQYDGLVDTKTGCRCITTDTDRPCDDRFCADCEPYPSQIPLGTGPCKGELEAR